MLSDTNYRKYILWIMLRKLVLTQFGSAQILMMQGTMTIKMSAENGAFQ
jgi:hypothetical protein